MRGIMMEPIAEGYVKVAPTRFEYEDYKTVQAIIDGRFEVMSFTEEVPGGEKRVYDVLFDAEGKFNESLLPSLALIRGNQLLDVIVGKILILKSNARGEWETLDDLDMVVLQVKFRELVGLVRDGKEYLYPYLEYI